MNKILYLFFAFAMLAGCSQKQDEQQTNSFEDKEYSYNAENLTEHCSINSEIACAIEAAVKCIINPKISICEKLNLPEFVFMDDESLQRPTEQSFRITKLKPLAENVIEVHTIGKCNGNMFGLCNGNIIYVLKNRNGSGWAVSDVYAVE